jgi:hypothetical protein
MLLQPYKTAIIASHSYNYNFSLLHIIEMIIIFFYIPHFQLFFLQQPPAWSCCSRTRTFLPALANSIAVLSPPIPLPITIASRLSGTLGGLNSEK